MMGDQKTIRLFGFNLDQKISHSLMAYFYLAAFIVIGLIFGFSPFSYLLLFFLLGIFILPQPRLGLGLIIFFTMIFERFFTLQPLIINQQIYKIYPLDIIILLTLVGSLFYFKKYGRQLLFGWPEKILFVIMIVNSIYWLVSLNDINSQFAVAFSTFKNYTFYPILYFLTYYLITDAGQFKKIIKIILAGGLAIILFIAAGWLRGQGFWTEFTPLSTPGVRYLAGTHAFYLTLTSLLTLSLLSFKRFRSQIFINLILWIWLIGIIGSLMRHLWLALALAALVLFIFLPKKNKIIFSQYSLKNGLILLSLMGLIFLFINIFPEQNLTNEFQTQTKQLTTRAISFLTFDDDSSASWRLDLWRSARKIWLTNPIFGVGLGKNILLDLGDWQTTEEIRNLHNSPLAILVQTGLIGLGLLLSFIASIFIMAGKKILNNKELLPYFLGLTAGVAMLIFSSFFQPYLETNLSGIFLWIFLGLIRAASTINQQNENPANQ